MCVIVAVVVVLVVNKHTHFSLSLKSHFVLHRVPVINNSKLTKGR